MVKLEKIRSNRDQTSCDAALLELGRRSEEGGNLLEAAIEAARQRATVGEISLAMEASFGRHRAEVKTLAGIYGSVYQGDEDFVTIQKSIEDFAKIEGRRPRILVVKMGQDGHDRGAKVIATAFADIGFDVDVGPLFQTPEEAAQDAVDNDVHVVGISSQAAGHKTLLITGALDIAVEPLRPMFDHIVAAEIAQKDGLLTGEMAKVPPTGEVRAQLMLEWATREGLDPSQGVAYADSASDLPMLEAVGYPVAVNPETRLVTIAEKRGWLTENWPKTPGAPNSILPMGPKAPRVTNQRGNNS